MKINISKYSQITILFMSLFILMGFQDAAPPFKIEIPIKCTAQKNCFMQNYVDVDPTRQIKDFSCGRASYDGHKGIDIRLISMAHMLKGVPVLASYDGTVKGVRDKMEDKIVASVLDIQNVRGRECGNGVVIDHGGGWESQYCHMKKGSLLVTKGQKVKTGEPLGLVGSSGYAQFAHLHLSLRYKGKVIDPYSGRGNQQTNNSCGVKGTSLLSDTFLKAFPYKTGQIIETGFTTRLMKNVEYELGMQTKEKPQEGKNFIFFARGINLQKGDKMEIIVTRGDHVFAKAPPTIFKKFKAVYTMQGGRRWNARTPYPKGTYKGLATISRKGKIINRKEKEFILE